MKIGVYQNHPEFGSIEKNVQQAVSDLRGVEADLMVLPELFSTGYQFTSREEVSEMAEEIPEGLTCRVFMELARSKEMFLDQPISTGLRK